MMARLHDLTENRAPAKNIVVLISALSALGYVVTL